MGAATRASPAGFVSTASWPTRPVSAAVVTVSTNGCGGSRADADRLTGSPMSLYDFYMYLKYIEYSAENLEFYIW